MPIIIDNQPHLANSFKYRLSIQADLNGFSFLILDETDSKPLYLYNSSFAMERDEMEFFSKKCKSLFEKNPLLQAQYRRVDLLWGSEKFTLIPTQLSPQKSALEIMESLFKIEELEEINSLILEKEQMEIFFAVNSTFLNMVSKFQPNFNLYPTVYPFLSYLPHFPEYNKLLFSYHRERTIIVATEGERIIHCCSYPTQHFNTGLYFLFLILKEIQFNPEQTTVYIHGTIKEIDIYNIATYFSQVKYFRNPEIALPTAKVELNNSLLTFKLN